MTALRRDRTRRPLTAVASALVVASAVVVAPLAAEASPGQRQEIFHPNPQPANPPRAAVPGGFQDSIAWSGFTLPAALVFAANGRVYVGEKSGIVKTFDNLGDTSATTALDLRTPVDDYWDRGLLGLAADPQFGAAGHNYLYALYAYDAPPGKVAPVWNDNCLGSPNGPGPTTDGCVVQGQLSRIPMDPVTGVASGAEQVLIGPSWCQQFPSHSVGQIKFGADGALYMSAGDGASFNFADWGQAGGTIINPGTGQPYTPANPCGDPPNGFGVANTSPNGRGGALRSQSPRRPAGEDILLDGDILRVDPATGNGLPDNPLFASTDPDARRIVAFGLRNPFRITVRPGTNEVWVGDVGWNTWEEINRIPNPTAALTNFGWPCYEGVGQQSGYAGLAQCQALYADGGNPATAPYYTYNHSATLGGGDTCRTGSSSISGMAFYSGTKYPVGYGGALFFGDHSRSCIWVMKLGANGQPDPTTISTFVDDSLAPDPVAIETEPVSGDVFYVDYDSGTIHRITALNENDPPTAVAVATTPTSGARPLTVSFSGSQSSDPDGDTLTYSWDLNGDGVYGDSSLVAPSYTYTADGVYSVTLRVTDPPGATSTSAPIVVNVGGNTAPVPVIDTPDAMLHWTVGQTIAFTGHATDQQDGTLTGSALAWTLILHHCPSDCHTHIIGSVGTGTSGSFTAPDHEYPSYLELQLTATDSGGLSASTSLFLDPQTVVLTFSTAPAGFSLTVNGVSGVATFTRTVIVGSMNTVSAPATQIKGRKTYGFSKWSDQGTATHTIVAPAVATTYTATYRRLR